MFAVYEYKLADSNLLVDRDSAVMSTPSVGQGGYPDMWNIPRSSKILLFPIANRGSQVTKITVLIDQNRQALGSEWGEHLLALRDRAIAAGMPLLSQEEILAETHQRRGGDDQIAISEAKARLEAIEEPIQLARKQRVQALHEWLESLPPVPSVPLTALDRDELY